MNKSEVIENYLSGSYGIATLLDGLTKESNDFNLMLSDLDHFLELEDLTDVQIARLTILRKKVLQDRRSAKDSIHIIERILPKQVEGSTTKDRYESAVHNLASRVYTPRKLVLSDILGNGE